MPFEAYLTAGYKYAHENDMFASLVAELSARFGPEAAPHVLIGNLLIGGQDIDAIFLKPGCIAVIEMKAHRGKLRFSENFAWSIESDGAVTKVKGGTKENPYLQVRAYRFGVKGFLQTRQLDILRRVRNIVWEHVSGVVVFGGPLDFDPHVLGNLRLWFHITDLSRITRLLAGIRSPMLQLTPEEIRAVPQIIGVTREHLYNQEAIPTADPLQAAPPPVLRRQFTYLKEFAIRDQEQRMNQLGGSRAQGAQRLRTILGQVRQGTNPFASMPNRADARIEGAKVYPMNPATELVLIEKEAGVIPAFFGEPPDVEGWLAAHAGLTVSVDLSTGRYSVTAVSGPSTSEALQPPALGAEARPLLEQIDGLHLEELVPVRKIREALLAVVKDTTDEEIKDTIDMVADEDVRRFLLDIVNFIRAGDTERAIARLKLRHGEAVPLDDTGAFGQAAAASLANSDQIKVLNDISREELDRLLDPRNFQDWMLFLHPDQQGLVEAEFDRPVVLTGVSGSGKTCVLVHRARYLARKYPDRKIGVLALGRSLAGLLDNLVKQLLTEEERKNVSVLPFYDVFRDCLSHLGPSKYFAQLAQQVGGQSQLHAALKRASSKWPDGMVWNCDPISKVRVEDEWEDFYMSRDPNVRQWLDGIVKYLQESGVDACRYLEEEFMLIRSQFAVPNRSNYLNTEERKIRAGRAVQFRQEIRRDALQLLLCWEEWLLAGGMIDDLGLTQALMPLHGEMQQLPPQLRFRCLLVDEFQDFSTLDLQLLRRIVPIQEPDALFLAGDTVQKILVKRQSLQDAALDRGAAIHKSIRKNYRNSKQILLAASRLANHYGAMAKAQEEEVEVLNPELAQRVTNPPIILQTDDQIAKAWELALECSRDNTEPWTVCIATAAPQEMAVADILRARPEGLAARTLTGDCILHPDEIVVGTIGDLKGFEFKMILILGCDADDFPEAGVPGDEVWRDALRLYVAMTRGRDQVYILHGENPSEFLKVFGDSVIARQEPVLKPYARAQEQVPAAPAAAPPQAAAPAAPRLDRTRNCEDWFSAIELEALHHYFARYVYREDDLCFKDWVNPKGLATVRPNLFYNLHRDPPTVISGILTKLQDKGVIHLRTPRHGPGNRNRRENPASNQT
jgi:hypothetical protein